MRWTIPIARVNICCLVLSIEQLLVVTEKVRYTSSLRLHLEANFTYMKLSCLSWPYLYICLAALRDKSLQEYCSDETPVTILRDNYLLFVVSCAGSANCTSVNRPTNRNKIQHAFCTVLFFNPSITEVRQNRHAWVPDIMYLHIRWTLHFIFKN